MVRDLNNKEKYHLHDCGDLDYYGIRVLENLFDKVNEENYYKPILVKSLLRAIIMKAEGIKILWNIMKAEGIKKIISKTIS